MSTTFYIAEQGQTDPGVWYIKDYNVPENCAPIVLALTTSAKYADLIVNALNAQAKPFYSPAFDEGDGSYKP